MRFNSRFATHFGLALLALTGLSACSIGIGDGNGITKIEIYDLQGLLNLAPDNDEVDGDSDITGDVSVDESATISMRTDQCEGLQLVAVARFTDNQANVYTHRVNWSVVEGNVDLVYVTQDYGDDDPENDIVIRTYVVPNAVNAPGDTAIIRAEYQTLSTDVEITFSDEVIDAVQISPNFVEVLAGQSERITTNFTTSEGNKIAAPQRGFEFSLSNDTAFTLEETARDGVFALNSIEDPDADKNETELQVTSCHNVAGLEKTQSIKAINYRADGANAPTLEIRNSANGTTQNGDFTIPQAYSTAVGALLLFEGGSSTAVSNKSGDTSAGEANTEWTTTDSIDSADLITTEAAFLGRTVTAAENHTGTATLTATFTAADGTVFSDSVNVKVAEKSYQDQTKPFDVRNELRQSVTLNNDATISDINVANLGFRYLHYVAKLKDDTDTPYEVLVSGVKSDVVNKKNLAVSRSGTQYFGALAHLAEDPVELGESEIVHVTLDPSDFDATVGDSLTNNIENIYVKVFAAKPDSFVIDADMDYVADTSFTLSNIGEIASLFSLLEFTDQTSMYRNPFTSWISSDPSIVAVDFASGEITAVGTGSATITAKTQYSYANGLDTDGNPQLTKENYSASITVEVTTASP